MSVSQAFEYRVLCGVCLSGLTSPDDVPHIWHSLIGSASTGVQEDSHGTMGARRDEGGMEAGYSDEEDGTGGRDDRRFCYCGRGEYGPMLVCDNEDCPSVSFHLGCTDRSELPGEDET